MKNILIGGAWPYANGSLHIGHIAGGVHTYPMQREKAAGVSLREESMEVASEL